MSASLRSSLRRAGPRQTGRSRREARSTALTLSSTFLRHGPRRCLRYAPCRRPDGARPWHGTSIRVGAARRAMRTGCVARRARGPASARAPAGCDRCHCAAGVARGLRWSEGAAEGVPHSRQTSTQRRDSPAASPGREAPARARRARVSLPERAAGGDLAPRWLRTPGAAGPLGVLKTAIARRGVVVPCRRGSPCAAEPHPPRAAHPARPVCRASGRCFTAALF